MIQEILMSLLHIKIKLIFLVQLKKTHDLLSHRLPQNHSYQIRFEVDTTKKLGPGSQGLTRVNLKIFKI